MYIRIGLGEVMLGIGILILIGIGVLIYQGATSGSNSGNTNEPQQATPVGEPDLEITDKSYTLMDGLSVTVKAYGRVPDGTIRVKYFLDEIDQNFDDPCAEGTDPVPTLQHGETHTFSYPFAPDGCWMGGYSEDPLRYEVTVQP